MTERLEPKILERHRDVARDLVSRSPLICGPCGAPLPNPECGVRKNGLSPCCVPQTESLEEDIARALAAERAIVLGEGSLALQPSPPLAEGFKEGDHAGK